MKLTKKIKVGILAISLCLVTFFTIMSLTVQAALNSSYPTIQFEYEAYSKEGYKAYFNAKICNADGDLKDLATVKALLSAYENLPETTTPQKNKKKNFFLTGDGAGYNEYYIYAQNPDGSYDMDNSPDDFATHTRGTTSEEIYAALKSEVEAYETQLANAKLSAINPGQEIVIAVNASFTDSDAGIFSVVAILDIGNYVDKTVPYEFYENASTASAAHPHDTVDSGRGVKVGFSWGNSASGSVATPAFIGAVGLTVSPTATEFNVSFLKPEDASNPTLAGGTLFSNVGNSLAINARQNAENFTEIPLELSVAAKSSDTSLIELTVEGKDALNGGSVSGASSTSYVGSEISDGTANVTAKVKDNGTITAVKYSTNLATVDGTNPGGTSVSPNAGAFSIPMASVGAGENMYCAIQATASDGVTTKWYVVALPKAKDTNCNLDGATFTGTNSSGSQITLAFQGGTPNFATGTTFTVLVPKGTTNIMFTPTFNSPKSANINADSNWTAVSGTAVNVSGLSTVRITVRAQDTSKTKAYIFNMLEVDTKPSSVTVGANGVTDTDTDADGDKYYDLTVPAGFRNFSFEVALPNGATASYTHNGSTVSSWNGSAKTLTLSESDNSKAVTNELITLVVDNNGQTETYYVRVSRPAADNDGSFNIVDTKYFATQSDTTGTAFSTTHTGTAYSNTTNLPYGTYGIQYNIVPTSNKTKIYINSSEVTGIQSLTLSTSKIVTFVVKTELDQVTNGTGTTYTLQIKTAQPEGLPSSFTLNLISTKDSGILDNTYPPTMSNSNLKYTYRLPVETVGNYYKMDIDINTNNSTIYVTATKPSNVSSLGPTDVYNKNNTHPIGTTSTAEYRYITVVAEDGNYRIYDVEVYAAKATENRIKNIKIFDPVTNNNLFTFNENVNVYTNNLTGGTGVHFPYSVKSVSFEVELYANTETLVTNGTQNASSSVIKTGTINLSSTNGTIQFTVQGQAEDGTLGTKYQIDLTRDQARSGALINSIEIYDVNCKDQNPNHYSTPFDSMTNASTPFNIIFDRNSLPNDEVRITVSDGATFEIIEGSSSTPGSPNPYNISVNPGAKKTIQVKVTSEKDNIDNTGKSTVYVINIYRGSIDKEVTDINILESQGGSNALDVTSNTFSFNSNASTQTKFVVPYATSSVWLNTIVPSNAYSTIEYKVGNGAFSASPAVNLTAGATTNVTVRVTSEVGKLDSSLPNQYTEYVIPIERTQCSHQNELSNLIVEIDGVAQTFTIPSGGFSSSILSYTIDQLTAKSSSVTFRYTKKDSSATVTVNGNSASSETNNNTEGYVSTTINLSSSVTSEIVNIDVTCQCGQKKQYQVRLTTERAQADTIATIDNIIAYTKAGNGADQLTTLAGVSGFAQSEYNYEVKLTKDASDSYVNLNIFKSSQYATLNVVIDGGTPITTKDPSKVIQITSVPYGATKTVEVYAVAEDGTHQSSKYTIIISRESEPSHDVKLLDLKVNGNIAVPNFDPTASSGNYTVYLEDATDAWIQATLNDPKAKVTSNPSCLDTQNKITLSVGDNRVIVTVTAEDGTTTGTYYLNLVKDAPKTLDSLEAMVDGSNVLTPTFVSTQYTGYKVSLDYSQSSVKMVYQTTDTNGNITVELYDYNGTRVNGDTFTNIPTGKHTYKVRLTAASPAGSGKYKEYSIEIDRATGGSDASIQTYEYYKNPTDSIYTNLPITNSLNYTYVVSRDNLTFNPQITLTDPKAKWSIGETGLQVTTLTPGQLNSIQIKVTPEDASAQPKYYTFNVYPCDEDFDIDDINALIGQGLGDTLGSDGTSFIDYENGVLSISVPNTTSTTYLEVLGGGYGSQVYVNGKKYTNQLQSLAVGVNTFEIYIKSEYGEKNPNATSESNKVTITITREDLSHDADLIELEVSYEDENGVKQTVSHQALPSTSPLIVPELPMGVKNVSIKATPKDSKASVTGDGAYNLDLLPDSNGVFNINVVCTAEDGTTKKTYPVSISRQKIDLSTDNSITYIILRDSNGNTYLEQATFDPTQSSYGPYKIPFSATSYTITVVKTANSPSETWIDGIYESSNSQMTVITSGMRGTTKKIPVYCLAQKDSAKGPEYTLEVEFESPSTDTTFKELLADGVMVPGFAPTDNGGEYTVGVRPYTTETIDFTYITTDPKAVVTGDIGVQNLKVGQNVFVIRVTAEDGSYSDYKIYVQRDYPLPYLTDLNVVGEQLLNANEKETTFDKETYTYNVIVTYNTFTATINASVDNETHNVAASNCTVLNNTGLTRTFTTNLEIGPNPITFTVVSAEGKSVEYKLIIQRRDKDSANANVAGIEILQIPVFKEEYSNLKREYSYVVPNGIRNLDVIVHPEKGPDAKGDGATYKIINDKNLRVGHNTLVILVFAEDQVTTKAILVDVERLPMSYTVDQNAYDYTCTKLPGQNAYEIDLVDKRADAIEDYTKYILFPEGEGEAYDKNNQYTEKPEVTVVSDLTDANCREVVLRIYDGDQEEFVTLKLKSSALTNGMSIPEVLRTIFPWILLVIAIIILIFILICVNRDKFGSINKKRKKEED